MSSHALDRLVRGGIVSELEAPRVAGLWDEIGRLKRDKRAFGAAHKYMKAIDLESVYRTLRDEPADRRVIVPHGVRAGAARAMLRMIELGA